MAHYGHSFLLGSGALVVWGEVDAGKIDEDALNDWWTNEHLPERLSIPGFLRARRYYSRGDTETDTTKYLTLYEVRDLETLTSREYMEKLNNPTKGTEQHIPTLATMQRAACEVMHAEVRQELKTCRTGVGATLAVMVLSLPAGDKTSIALRSQLSKAFANLQKSNKRAMAMLVLQENQAATEPGSASQSYLNVKLQPSNTDDSNVRWIVVFEFSASSRRQSIDSVHRMLKPVVDALALAHDKLGEMRFDVYEILCCIDG